MWLKKQKCDLSAIFRSTRQFYAFFNTHQQKKQSLLEKSRRIFSRVFITFKKKIYIYKIDKALYKAALLVYG